jgi:hypothetical protein
MDVILISHAKGIRLWKTENRELRTIFRLTFEALADAWMQ